MTVRIQCWLAIRWRLYRQHAFYTAIHYLNTLHSVTVVCTYKLFILRLHARKSRYALYSVCLSVSLFLCPIYACINLSKGKSQNKIFKQCIQPRASKGVTFSIAEVHTRSSTLEARDCLSHSTTTMMTTKDSNSFYRFSITANRTSFAILRWKDQRLTLLGLTGSPSSRKKRVMNMYS